MIILRKYKAIVLEDCFYGSGRRFLKEGQAAEVTVSEMGRTIWVSDPDFFSLSSFVFSTDDEDWIWRHLAMEGP